MSGDYWENLVLLIIMNISRLTEEVCRRLLREKSREEDLAAVVDFDYGANVIVYDVSLLKAALKDYAADEEADLAEKIVARQAIRGIIDVGPAEDPCNGAWVVSAVAGKGLGKILYGLAYALSPSGLIAPDRRKGKVSPDAQAAWRKVAAGGRERVKMDDVDHPKTPQEDDDCKVHGIDALDAAYRAEGWEKSMKDRLVKAHETLLTDLKGSSDPRLAAAGKRLGSVLYGVGRRFFSDALSSG